VGVVGGGIAGLQTIAAFKAKGYEVTAFDKAPAVGGLWRTNYLGYGVQVPKEYFEFSDYPSPAPSGKFVDGASTQEYILDYAKHFKLDEHVQTGTTVEKVEPKDGGWQFTTKKDGVEQTHQFDFCVVSQGMYSTANRFIPDVGSKEEFKGEAMHSTDFQQPEQVAGKNVVVVGGGKSAMDCAIAASNSGAKRVTLVSRNAHWPTPRKIAGLIPFQYVFLSRFGTALVVGHKGALPGTPNPMPLWHSLGWPLMAAAFKAVEVIFAAQFNMLRGPTSPLGKSDVLENFYGYAHVLDTTFQNKVKEGAIRWHIGNPERYTASGLQASGEELEADVVVFATGYGKDYSVFTDEVRGKLDLQTDGHWLYRHTLPTAVPNLAFVGSELATISNISSYGIQAAWVAKMWAGEIPTPAAKEMEEEITANKAWKRKWMPLTTSRASLVLLHQTHFHDMLLKDMGLPHRRKGANVFAEFFAPYAPADYKGVIGA